MGNYYRKVLTRNLTPLVNISGIDQLTKQFYAGKGHILMFHRVIPIADTDRIHNHLSLEVSPQQLDNILLFFKKRNYDIINLDILPAWLENNKKTNRRFVIFTFDDGYKDNLEFAYPVFKKHNAQFVIYVTNSFPDKRAVLWWYILEKLILEHDRIEYSFSEKQVDLRCVGYTKKEMAFTTLRNFITKLNDNNIESELTGFFAKFGYGINEFSQKLALSWGEVAQLSKDSIVTIGAHTLNHYNLCNLSDEQSLFEIQESKRLIEIKIEGKVNHFSYPLGKYGLREIEFASKSGYQTSTTTEIANIFVEHLDHLYSLPRISINSLTNEKVLKLQINGFMQF